MRNTGCCNISRKWLVVSFAIALTELSIAPVIYADHSNPIVLVSPMELPALARQGGEAMFLRDSADGRRLLYIEQDDGAQLAIFDVTDPAHVTGQGSVQVNAPGPFDIVADLGKRGELVRFRGGLGEALLDLRKTPTLRQVPGLDIRNSTVLVTDDDSRFAAQTINPRLSQGARDYKIFQSGDSPSDDRILEVPQVHQEATNADTGTTFLLAASGLYLIRRPALEATPVEANSN